jgi:hypothetical protein
MDRAEARAKARAKAKAHQMEAQHPEEGGPGVGEQQLIPALVELLAPLEPREESAHVYLGA